MPRVEHERDVWRADTGDNGGGDTEISNTAFGHEFHEDVEFEFGRISRNRADGIDQFCYRCRCTHVVRDVDRSRAQRFRGAKRVDRAVLECRPKSAGHRRGIRGAGKAVDQRIDHRDGDSGARQQFPQIVVAQTLLTRLEVHGGRDRDGGETSGSGHFGQCGERLAG